MDRIWLDLCLLITRCERYGQVQAVWLLGGPIGKYVLFLPVFAAHLQLMLVFVAGKSASTLQAYTRTSKADSDSSAVLESAARLVSADNQKDNR